MVAPFLLRVAGCGLRVAGCGLQRLVRVRPYRLMEMITIKACA